MTLNFGNFPKITVQDGLVPLSKARLDVINLMAEKQKDKGLILITTESGEIMWVHVDIINDEQWETSKSKLKGKSCNAFSFAADDDSVTIASLGNIVGEMLTLAAQPSTSLSVGTRSSR